MDKTGREVLIPGSLLPSGHRGEGRFHGVVTCVKRSSTAVEAFISISDLRNVRLKLPWEEAQLYLLDPPSEDMCTRWEVGTQLLAKVRGWKCHWPVVVWSARLCLRKDMAQLLESHKQERMLVRFYGERSMMWVREEDLQEGSLDDGHVAEMQNWERLHRRPGLVQSVLEELEGACGEPAAEVARLQHLQRIHSFSSSPSCTLCLEQGAELHCGQCQRALHALCLQQPCLAPSDLPEGAWDCPCCGQANSCLGDEAEVDTEEKVERMGLTPDWIIQAAAFVVFRLPRPTPEQPFIAGLLDPCTNSMIAPNIPAQVLYDKKLNGLLMSNSWAGYHILLNPDYSAATQWRFVNRAIDEVENDRVPAVLLVCRNSTDTAYFQRLRPYPRVMLRRSNCAFKDYDKTPIGFGVAVFCIAKAPCKELHERFFDGFAAMGEPNIPIDKALMQSVAFLELLGRLKRHSEEHQRDHWIQCSLCVQWRIITYDTLLQVRSDASWTCAQLRPPFSSCRTPSSKRELAGSRGYATINSSGQAPEYFSPGEPLDIGAAPSLPEDVAAQTAVIPGLAAECACLGEAASGTPEAWPSTDSEVEGASSGGSCEGLVTAGDLPRCQSTAHGHSSCSAGSAVLGSNDTVASESGTLEDGRENTADVTAIQSGADCASEAALQGSEQEADSAPPQVAQPGHRPAGHFLQAALQRLPPSHALPACGLDSVDDEECQQLSAIELARNARIAANRAYMASISASFTCTGSIAAGESLPVDHPLVLAAARELAQKAALEQARQQVEAAERQWETGQRVRRLKAAELRLFCP
ncbi:hypothetical protein WJX75_002780 [Coccomyxa subellipsoidea]|uniref:PHD-type domain-containing protein n=1 Tax=Coccomyxa subellipsoidea TaxID=248742 RepID=A0ABR2YVJ4_9CHLO